MANDKNTDYYAQTTKDTIPASTALTGTVTTSGIYVKGSSTLFKTQLQKGSWIYDAAQNEVRKVVSVNGDSDIDAQITHAFSADLSAVALVVVKRTDLNIRELSFYADATDAKIEAITLKAGVSVNYGKTGDSKDNFKNFIDPVIVDATGTTVYVTILK